MNIELSFSESDRNHPRFKDISDFVSSILETIPEMLEGFLNSKEESIMARRKRKKRVAKVFVSRGGIRL